MKIDWNDLKLFLDVARMGGLSAARRATGLSAATLGRRVNALEDQVGERLFVRAQTGYRLTPAGEDLRQRAAEIETAMQGVERWHDARHGVRVVRISAGNWTSAFLAGRIADIWTPEDRHTVELVTADTMVDIGRRQADIGVRNARPTEQWLAGRQIGHVAFALYSGRQLIGGLKAGMFIGLSGPAITPSARWLEAHHGDRIGVRGNDGQAIRALAAAGAGMAVLPCFIGDSDERLVRVAGPIAELRSEQWLVTHHDERHNRAVRQVSDAIARLMKDSAALFDGNRTQ